MSTQRPDFSHEFRQESDPTAMSMLHHLHSTTLDGGSHLNNTKSAPLFASFVDQSTKCGAGGGGGSTMRQSPSSSSSPSQQEPSSKRATFQPPSSSTAATNSTWDFCIHGFNKLPLPSSVSSATSPVLRRTASAPINSPGPRNFSVDQLSNEAVGNFLNHHLPPVTSTINSVAASPSAPLYRTVSDPTYARAESPVTKRLNRMKHRLRDMTHWCNEVIKEGEEDIGSEHTDNLPKVDEPVPMSQETEGEAPGEKAVWVERKGNCLILHFKCPCAKGYQILLCENNCYYKLT